MVGRPLDQCGLSAHAHSQKCTCAWAEVQMRARALHALLSSAYNCHFISIQAGSELGCVKGPWTEDGEGGGVTGMVEEGGDGGGGGKGIGWWWWRGWGGDEREFGVALYCRKKRRRSRRAEY